MVDKWGDANTRADAHVLLENKISVERLPGTSLVEVVVHHSDPDEAAQLANAIGKAYKTRRIQSEMLRSTSALDMLNAQEKLQEQKVEDARQRMIEMMEKFDIVDMAADGRIDMVTDAVPTNTASEIRQLEELLNRAGGGGNGESRGNRQHRSPRQNSSARLV